MGNYRFKLSDMIPNAWFYKLRDMNKMKTTTTTTTNHHKKTPSTTTQNNHFSQPRNSFYYTPRVSQFHNNNNSPKFPHFHDPPRKSSKKTKPNRKTIYKPSPKHTSLTEFTESTHTLQDFFHSPTPTINTTSPSSESTQSCTCRLSSSTSDIIIDVNNAKKPYNSSVFDDLKLAPIITKQTNLKSSLSGKNIIKESNINPGRKSISGIKLRSKSPKVTVSKRIVRKSTQQKNLSASFAVVKSSFDPKKDFMESMMEMIVENNIKSSKDLEELLACYLSLNSDEYHDVIVKAFEQIWFSLPDL